MNQHPHPPIKSEASASTSAEASANSLVKSEPDDEPMRTLPSLPPSFIKSDPDRQPGDAKDDEDDDGLPDLPQPERNQPDFLEQLINQNVPEVLEAGMSIAVDLLDQIKAPLSTFSTPDVDAWLKTIGELKERTKPTRTVVGVVGNTGAGKSSVINALLDEERLLPTNCLRACTASPTEISYNYSDDPTELYQAEIEFISAQDWIRELEVLFKDLLDGNGEVSRECSNADSEAGIAYAKLKAVYPSKTKEMLAAGSPAGFANEASVKKILGTVKTLKEESAKDLYGRLQHYVDSREKVTGNEHRKRNVPMEYWPLIKVVRIYTKAHALSTGAVIVDLPGVQDSNAARAAVAANYMKSCTGLWIVAPITRAVDDKTAKSLLGDTFKRQLKYDGTYSAVSFICSKTDDISITEAAESLGLEEETSESWSRAVELEDSKKSCQRKMREMKEAKAAFGEQLDELDAKYDIWEDLQNDLSNGKTVYAPSENSKKRKRGGDVSGSRKNHKSSDEDDDWDALDSDTSDKENSQPDENRKPLTEEEIDDTLASFKSQKKQIRGERRTLDAQIAELRKEIQDAETERQDILAELKALCIKGRNEYSRGAIKQDFAMGIKELDQENAIEEDDTAFDPDQDIRDYDEVARSLPVFCVSSRAYQKLSGRLKKDDFQSHGFMSMKDTEVPALQEHAKKLTEAGRASHCRRFLNDLTQLINSMKLWATNDGTQSTLTDVEKRREEMHLRKLLDDLEKGFETSVKEAMSLLHQSLHEHVYQTFDSSIPLAVNAALDTANGWGAHRDLGGLHWATYKATVRRNGAFRTDFNEALFSPISRNLATSWERAFQRRLPAVLDGFASKTQKLLGGFHKAAKERAEQRHTNVSGILTLSSQIMAHMRTLEQLPLTLRETITNLQRDASREFVPQICEAMMYAYQVCTDERGTGSYARMKAAMAEHVDHSRHTMFRQATDVVKAQLEKMCRTVEEQMLNQIEDIFEAVFRDYMSVLVGTTVDRRSKISPQELAMRTNVNSVLLRGDSMFASVLGITDEQESEGMDGLVEAPQPATSEPVQMAQEEAEQDNIHDSSMRTAAMSNAQSGPEFSIVKDEPEEDPMAADELIQQQIMSQQSPDQYNESDSESDDDLPDIDQVLARCR
ncbi:hypothetical protein F5B20DRAFT_586283 [Whalleya microplaca]|nr:hypothetical protein F5B20DRAFT_586283 [Whalleya microplaca]